MGYIWYFNGLPREERNNYMKKTYEELYEN